MRFAGVSSGGSHQMAMAAIGRELQKKGHEFLLLGTDFQAKQLRLSDIAFQVIGASRIDPVERYYERANAGAVSISSTLEFLKGMADLLCTELPPILRSERIDFVLADQEQPGAATASDLAQLPYASICASIPLNEDPDVPPGFLPWPHSGSVLARLRNRLGYAIRNTVVSGVNHVLNRHRQTAHLPPYRKPDDSFSRLAQISQLVEEFDFPHKHPIPAFHFVGPFHRQSLSQVDFPYDRLSGQPLIYASFGTTFGMRLNDLRAIAEACAPLPVQLVVSLGGAKLSEEHGLFPGNPIVVSYAPQHELLSRSALVVTHAGLNTTMEALSMGVPLLALPIAGDQFGAGARIAFHGAGTMLGPRQRSVPHLRAAIQVLLQDSRWRTGAQRLRTAIARSGGAAQAAAIVETLVNS